MHHLDANEKLEGNYAIILIALLNTFWNQQLTKEELFGLLLPISQE